jgi:hypothetical protein
MFARGRRCFLWLALAAGLCSGCATQTASLELITVARRGLSMAQEAQVQQHAQQVGQLGAQSSALDAAFDADVKLVASGQLKDPQGQSVTLTPEWIISARKGYAVARDQVAEQLRQADSAHATRIDNLRAADEALEMATQLILQQTTLGNTVRQQMLDAQRKLAGPQK